MRETSRRVRHRRACLALVGVLSLAQSACGGDEQVAAPAAATPAPAVPTTATTTPAPVEAAPPPAVEVAAAPVAPPAPATARAPRAAAAAPKTSPIGLPGARPNLGGDRHATAAPKELGRIEVPRIGLIHPIFEGIDLPQLHHGPGHWPGTAMPGQPGNVVLAGHRVTHTRPFLDIDLLAVGDRVMLTTAAGTFAYEVTGSQIVKPTDTWIVSQTPDATLTLFACHPKHSAARRYVVRGKLLPPV